MKAAGKSAATCAELLDLFPTLCGLCGLPSPDGLEGASLAPALADPGKIVKEAAFSQHPRPAYFDRTEAGVPEAMGYSVRTPAGRYTEWRAWKTGEMLAAEYYDHTADPDELTNRATDPKCADARDAARRVLHTQFPPDRPPAKR